MNDETMCDARELMQNEGRKMIDGPQCKAVCQLAMYGDWNEYHSC
jgi:hypothetical protein